MRAFLDAPTEDAVVQRHGIEFVGWTLVDVGRIREVEVRSGATPLGTTRNLYPRPDVDTGLQLAAGSAVGFTVYCTMPIELRNGPRIQATVEAVLDDGRRDVIGLRSLQYSEQDYRSQPFGGIFEPGFETLLRRDDMYRSGPPSPIASPECAEILFRYLAPDARVLDVGCGIGAYGRVFRERGRPWTGIEVREDFVAAMRAEGLDAHPILGGRIPFPDNSFDAAIAIEVIEHVTDLPAVLGEIARVAPKLALFSVPNAETIPITASFYALPWHMLEPTHVNFFTHVSLSASLRPHYPVTEVFEYGKLPLLRAVDGLPLNNHLFAVARSGR